MISPRIAVADDQPPNRGGGMTDVLFIDVEVDEAVAGDPELAAKLEEVCPVDIFAARDGRVEIVPENLDECVLCELCINAAPPGSVRVVKLYSDEALAAS